MDISVIRNDYPNTSAAYANDDEVESLPDAAQDSSASIPSHPLRVKPLGNQYSASINSRRSIGPSFLAWPDEILALFLDYVDSTELRLLGSTCKFLYAFCRSDDVWKTLFIE